MAMKRKRKKRLTALVLCGGFYTAWFVSAACGRQAGHAVFPFPQISMEDRSVDDRAASDNSIDDRAVAVNSIDDRAIPRYTSTSFRYPELFERTLDHYGDFQKLYRPELSAAVPGLAYTRFTDSSSSQMVPQGICLAGEYMLVTAYDRERRSNSVIYVMTRETDGSWRLLTVLELPEKNHVGGIAFDGTNIWIARSTSGYVSSISYETLKAAAYGGQSCRLQAYERNIYLGVTASFVTYYKGRLWVGTYRTILTGPGSLSVYRIEETEEGLRLRLEAILEIPVYVQGAQFLERGKAVYLIMAASSGRYADSRIYLYQMAGQEQAEPRLLHQYRFPPMAETLCSDGQTTYFLFESAATCYSTLQYQKCPYPVDRICGVPNGQLLEGKRLWDPR